MSRPWFGFISRGDFPGRATNDAWELTAVSIGRANSDDSPYLIPNEWICGNLAQFLRLPIPPFALMRENAHRKGMFASLRFGRGDQPPPDIRPDACVQRHPDLCAGILMFDIWIANEDRHGRNIFVDNPARPRDIRIYDHDRALFGCFAGYGQKRLKNLRDRLGCSGGSVTGGNVHCFLRRVADRNHLDAWYPRIANTPDWFIEDVCNAVVNLGITREEADSAIDFLKYRRTSLEKIVYENRAEFASIADWGLFP